MGSPPKSYAETVNVVCAGVPIVRRAFIASLIDATTLVPRFGGLGQVTCDDAFAPEMPAGASAGVGSVEMPDPHAANASAKTGVTDFVRLRIIRRILYAWNNIWLL